MSDHYLTETFRSATQKEVINTIKPHYGSFVERTMYGDFHFTQEKDANRFAREVKPSTQPNKDFLKGTWVVRL